jgi:hypothetical protein
MLMKGNTGVMSNYTKSILRPFDTTWIKPPHDYPLNTSIVETTHEMNIVPTSGGIWNGYGTSLVIYPHSYNDLVNTNG